LQKTYYWNKITQGGTEWTNASFVILHLTDLARKALTANMSIRGTKDTVFFAVQVHTAPAHTARIKNTSMVKAARNVCIAVHLQSVLAAAAHTESTKDSSLWNRDLRFCMFMMFSFFRGDITNQERSIRNQEVIK